MVLMTGQPPLVPRRPKSLNTLGRVRDTAGDSPSWAEEHRGEVASTSNSHMGKLRHAEAGAGLWFHRKLVANWKSVPQALP